MGMLRLPSYYMDIWLILPLATAAEIAEAERWIGNDDDDVSHHQPSSRIVYEVNGFVTLAKSCTKDTHS